MNVLAYVLVGAAVAYTKYKLADKMTDKMIETLKKMEEEEKRRQRREW